MSQRIAIYGAGGFAREVAWLIDEINSNKAEFEIKCFVDDDRDKQGLLLRGYPVVSLKEAKQFDEDIKFSVCIANPQVREKLVKTINSEDKVFIKLIHPDVRMSGVVDIGVGTIICAGCILTVDISIGRHVHINLDCTIGHDAVLEDFVTLAPGVHVSGNVIIRKRAFIGTGAVIINGTRENPIVIGEDAVVGAGACVTRSVSPKTKVVGVPARSIE